MNERIKELAEQAGMVKILEEHASEYGSGTFENTPYPELEKFAELIVRECANLVEGFEMTQQFAPDVIMNFEASWVLKEQFGIEE